MDHFAGQVAESRDSQPKGRRLSIAAATKSGARKASEIGMLTLRGLGRGGSFAFVPLERRLANALGELDIPNVDGASASSSALVLRCSSHRASRRSVLRKFASN